MLVTGLTQPEHQSHPLGQETPRHERECLHRHPVEPLGVVDDADERLIPDCVGQQAEHGQADQEAIGRRARAQAERGVQRVALRDRKLPEAAEHRRAQGVQAGEGELHLGFNARRPGDPAPCGGGRHVLQQGCLADPGLAAQDQHPALAGAYTGDELIQRVALAVTVDQGRR